QNRDPCQKQQVGSQASQEPTRFLGFGSHARIPRSLRHQPEAPAREPSLALRVGANISRVGYQAQAAMADCPCERATWRETSATQAWTRGNSAAGRRLPATRAS